MRMATLPAKPAMKDRILETADRLFYLQGIRAVGVDTIAAEIGISKRTLYNHFPSKDALISAYLARRFVAPRASDKSPVEQILGTFDSLERRFSAKDFRGCPFVNAVAELGSEDQSVRKIAVEFKESRRLWFRDLLVQLGVTEAEALATQLALLVDGSIAQDLVRNDPAMARAAKEAATVLLRNAGVKVGRQSRIHARRRNAGPSRRLETYPTSSLRTQGPIRRGLSIGRCGSYLLATISIGGYGSLRSQAHDARESGDAEGATMEDLKVTANGYDFKPAHAAMQRYVDGNLLSGISSAVMVGRDLVDVNCVGWADKEAQTPLRTDHIFRVFSNTKLITSCAALLLFEEGKLGLDDPIEKFIPQLGNRKVLRPGATSLDDTEPAKSSITIRQLLSHSSGLSYGFFDPGTVIFKALNERGVHNPRTTLADMVDVLAGLPLIYHPGTSWEYSLAIDVVARLVEVISGQTLRSSSFRRAFSIRSAWSIPASSFRKRIRAGSSPITPART